MKRVVSFVVAFCCQIIIGQVQNNEVLLYYAPWALESTELTCKIIAVRNPDGRFINHLKIMRVKENRDEIIFSDSTNEWVTALFPTKQLNGNLIVIWGGESEYLVKAYTYVQGEVIEALNTLSGNFPELLSDNKTDQMSIVVSDKPAKVRKAAAKQSAVVKKIKYTWNGFKYIVNRTNSTKKKIKAIQD